MRNTLAPMGGSMIVLEVRVVGFEFTDEDVTAVRREFGQIAPLRATGAWAPAAGPAAGVDIVLTFLGQTMAAVIVEKALEAVWRKVSASWKRYRQDRTTRGKMEPELDHIVIRADDVEVHVNAPIDPESDEFLALVAKIGQRLSDGALRNLPISTITLPSRRDYDGQWESVEPYDYDSAADKLVWYIEASSAEGVWGFYDARRDIWLE